MTPASLTVQVTATIKVRQNVDLVALFATMDERDRQRYRNLDIADLGMESEWERPLAFVWPEEADVVPLTLAPGARSPVWGDIDDATVRVEQRDGEAVYGREAQWSRADFDALIARVPWLRSFHESLSRTLSTEDLARIPGPDDVPMF